MRSFLSRFVRIVDALMNVVRALIAVVLVLSVLLNFCNVIGRKFLFHPIVGAEEVMNFLMVGVVFLGAGVVAYDGSHINMEIVIDRLPVPLRNAFRAFAQVGAVVVAGVIVVLGIPIVERLAAFNERSQAANVPLWVPQLMVPVGLTLLAIGALARLAMLAAPRAAERPPETAA